MEYRVEIGGEPVVLKYTVNSMCAMEDRVGGALEAVMERQYTAARLLLWAGMLEMHGDMTLKQAGGLIGAHIAAGGTLEEVVEACAEAMRRAGFFGKAAQAAD